MILVYAGKGKGKTSACVGQAIRALGSGLSVAFGQFMKRPGKAGEQIVLAELLGENYFSAGAGFYRSWNQYEEQRRKVGEVLDWALSRETQMLVLDEALLALTRNLLLESELLEFARARNGPTRHLVLSGPLVPLWLVPFCDIITEMRKISHAYDRGFPSTCGIEY